MTAWLIGKQYADKMAVKRRTDSRLDTSERGLVAAIRNRALAQKTNSIVHLGIGDDCAVLRPRPGRDLTITTDMSLEGVHFRRDWHPSDSIGHRCLARGLSDLAAMGARPEAAFLSLAMPTALTGVWMDGFFEGFFRLAKQAGVALAGGDLAKAAQVTADIVLVGSVPRGKALLRSTARAGDVIYVTGTLGGSAAGLAELARGKKRMPEGDPHLYPQPRLTAGHKLLRLATAAIDVSDGLSTDLSHLCEESDLAAEIELPDLPVDARATLEQALHGGEDYELLFTAAPRTPVPAELGGVGVHAIGRMKKRSRGSRMVLVDGKKRTPLTAAGWEHFRS
jgi:thiamine-monophosphate kinase